MFVELWSRFHCHPKRGVHSKNNIFRLTILEEFLAKEPVKKKRLIHLICRIRGEKVYDETKEAIEDIEIKVEDVDMVINEVLGKIKVETKDVL